MIPDIPAKTIRGYDICPASRQVFEILNTCDMVQEAPSRYEIDQEIEIAFR